MIVVGSQRVGMGEFQRMRAQSEQQYRDALGDSFDARALSETLDNLTARTLVERAVLAMEAQRLGLVVAKQEVEREILGYPAFRDASGPLRQGRLPELGLLRVRERAGLPRAATAIRPGREAGAGAANPGPRLRR